MADRVLKKTISTFKTAATYTPADLSTPYSIDGVFNQAYQSTDPDTGVVVTSIHPIFGIRLADLTAAPVEGDQVTVTGYGTYKVLDSQRDGEGGATLTLHKIG